MKFIKYSHKLGLAEHKIIRAVKESNQLTGSNKDEKFHGI